MRHFFDVPLDSRVKPRKLTPRIGGISKGTSSVGGYEAKKGLGAEQQGMTDLKESGFGLG